MKIGNIESQAIDGLYQTVYDSGELAAAATSVTISGLNGDVDGEYELIVRSVNGYDGYTAFLLRANNDSGSNYGYQYLLGASTNATAGRASDSSVYLIATSSSALGSLNMSHTIIHAKSGYVRTFIVKAADNIATTTVTGISLMGQSWNNTVDNLTSLVIYANQANGLGIGSRIILLRKVSATDGLKTGELSVQGTVKYAWQEIYRTTLESPISNADIDDEDMADITDWTDNDTGTGVSSQATFDSKSCMKLDSGGTGGGIAQRIQDIGTFGTRTVFSFTTYCDAIGTLAANDILNFAASNGTTLFLVSFCSDGLTIYDGSSEIEIGTNIVVQDTWQEWTFDVDWTTKTVDVYLNEALVQADADCSYNTAETNGTVYFYQNGATTINRISYINWFKAGSDLVALSSSGTRGKQTSLTVSGLTGNTDVLYRLKCRFVDDDTTGGYGLVINADTSTYGFQTLYGSNTTTGALRDTSEAKMDIGYTNTDGNISMSEMLLYAKAGFVRTAISTQAEDIFTTTVTNIGLLGQVYDNTTDEITSLVISANADKMNIGTEIVLERLNL